MGLTSSTIKQILLLINFILAVLGLLLISYGIIILVNASEATAHHGENYAGGLVVTMGIASVVISIFGCLGAIHESHRRLILYVISLVILILLQMIMTSMASMGTKDGLAGSIHDGFEQLWEHELNEPGSLAFYENWLHCCGVNNTADYHHIGHAIPSSCCLDHNCSLTANIYSIGCEEKFGEYIYDKFLIFKIVAYILIVLEIVGAVLAWMMVSTLRHEGRHSRVAWM